MECGEPCVRIVGITMMPQSCADSWGTVSIQVEVSSFIGKRIDGVVRSQMLSVCMAKVTWS